MYDIMIQFRASEVGAGATPAIWLGLIALLTTIRFGGLRLMEVMMKKNPKNSQRSTSKKTKRKSLVLRFVYQLALFLPSLIETTWAIGASLIAAIVPLSTYCRASAR
jgi:hypothetical protein